MVFFYDLVMQDVVILAFSESVRFALLEILFEMIARLMAWNTE